MVVCPKGKAFLRKLHRYSNKQSCRYLGSGSHNTQNICDGFTSSSPSPTPPQGMGLVQTLRRLEMSKSRARALTGTFQWHLLFHRKPQQSRIYHDFARSFQEKKSPFGLWLVVANSTALNIPHSACTPPHSGSPGPNPGPILPLSVQASTSSAHGVLSPPKARV